MGSEGSEISELEKYKKLFEESERSRKKLDDALEQSERSRKELDDALEQETLRRKEAELISRPTTIPEFLQEYHEIYTANTVETNQVLVTGGATCKPEHRKYPKRIIPWNDFTTQQEEVWDRISKSPIYSDRCLNPSGFIKRVQLVHVRSEDNVRVNEQHLVEIPAKEVLNTIYSDEKLRHEFQMPGKVTYLSHLNLNPGINVDTTGHSPKNNSLPEFSTPQSNPQEKSADKKTIAKYPKDTGGCADEFCVIQLENGKEVPAYNIEYKPPFKLTFELVTAGLENTAGLPFNEIQLDQDVIGQEGEGLKYEGKYIVSAVITQLFSYMIKAKVRYGYVSTGEVIIFVHILDNPEIVEYYLCVPSEEVDLNKPTTLHQTAVAQVLAFTLRAISDPAPSQLWHEAAARLSTWEVEFVDVFRSIVDSQRKNPKRSSAYKANLSKAMREFFRSPYAIRSKSLPINLGIADTEDKSGEAIKSGTTKAGQRRCKPRDFGHTNSNDKDDDKDDDNDDAGNSSPTPLPSHAKRSSKTQTRRNARSNDKKGVAGDSDRTRKQTTLNQPGSVGNREYCTQACLLGLATGGPLDIRCPNVADHGKKHLKKSLFLRMVQTQMKEQRDKVTDCKPLDIDGSRGTMFKITLTSHGYTIIAKGVQQDDIHHLRNEANVYHQLCSLQGSHIPVCIGSINLIKPYYHRHLHYVCEFVQLLLLSYAGTPVFKTVNAANLDGILSRVTTAIEAIHSLGVLHGDPYPRNILWNEQVGMLQIVDFERSKIRQLPTMVEIKQPLAKTSANKRRRLSSKSDSPKRARTSSMKVRPKVEELTDEAFAKEVRAAVWLTADCIPQPKAKHKELSLLSQPCAPAENQIFPFMEIMMDA